VSHSAIPPGATVGILGGGQLGRMTAMAAAAMGYRCHVFAPEPDGPAMQVAAAHTVAHYDDEAALGRFAQAVSVVTLEFENIPYDAVRFLEARVPMRPGWHALRLSQDRVLEKQWLTGEAGVEAAPFAPVERRADLDGAVARIGLPAILKSAQFGYDGKGQVRLEKGDDLDAAWRAAGGSRAILEGLVDFELEASVVIARGLDGRLASYVPVENRHREGILRETVAPAPLDAATGEAATATARRVAETLDLVGVLGVELFVTRDRRVLVNEIAPRPHNSGHWTLDACLCSQFEQHVRAVTGLPLGNPERHSDAVMENLIGADAEHWADLAAEPGARLHLYGKDEIRAGRKMGHVTRLRPRSEQ